MTTISVPVRPAGTAAVVGGIVVVGLGVVAAIAPDTAASAWFVIAGLAVGLLVIGLLGLRRAVADVPLARRALGVAAVFTTLFGLAHFYALVDADLAILLFSIFMVLGSVAVIVAGIAILRSRTWSGWQRAVPLIVGVWPVATIPAGAALGDAPHFLAIAIWGLCWVALGASLLTAGSRVSALR